MSDNRIAVLEAELAAAEDAHDRLAVRLGEIEDFVTGREDVPMEMVNRLIAGEHPVRVWREHRGMTSAELARRAH